MKIAAGRAFGAVWRVHAIPDRRMRLLQRRKFHRHIAEVEMLAVEIEHVAGQPLQDQFDAFA